MVLPKHPNTMTEWIMDIAVVTMMVSGKRPVIMMTVKFLMVSSDEMPRPFSIIMPLAMAVMMGCPTVAMMVALKSLFFIAMLIIMMIIFPALCPRGCRT